MLELTVHFAQSLPPSVISSRHNQTKAFRTLPRPQNTLKYLNDAVGF